MNWRYFSASLAAQQKSQLAEVLACEVTISKIVWIAAGKIKYFLSQGREKK